MMKHPCLKQTNDGLISTQGVMIRNDSYAGNQTMTRHKMVTKYATTCDQLITLLACHDAPASDSKVRKIMNPCSLDQLQ